MRTKNSVINFLASTGSHFINVILSFVVRTIFIYTLSAEYLGINGLFINVLTVLSFAELGIGTAMIYKLYEPVANDDRDMIRRLMNLYRRLYMGVAAAVAVFGLLLVPALPYLIADYELYSDMENLTLIYLLFLFDAVSSYFFSYKRSIIYANQRAYITTAIDAVVMIAQFLIQMIVLLVYKRFIPFLLIQVASSVIKNVICAKAADREYPFLSEDKTSLPDDEVRRDIRKNIGAMSLHRLGDIIVNNTDNLIMSAFVGLGAVGIFSNYIMIQATVNTALNGFYAAFTAGIGDLSVDEKSRMSFDRDAVTVDGEKSGRLFEVYKTLLFLSFWIYGFCSCAFLVMYNPFIEAWAGEKYLFDMSIVLSIVAVFYLNGMRRVTLSFRDAMGLFWYDRYKPIFEIIINLVASVILVQKLGVMGIFLGTVISVLTTCFWIEPLVTFRHGFGMGVGVYFRRYAFYTFIAALDTALTWYLCGMIKVPGWPGVFLKAMICVLVYNTVVALLFGKSREMKDVTDRLLAMRDRHQ
ncbi:MAG: hypothetical protein K6B14_09070 [Lachnospiraceae bacterium]|nr:hypothetical protein [Lachnospiraceae bacterium]